MNGRRFAAVLASVMVLTLVGAGCGSDDGGESDGSGAAAGATVTATDFAFDPSTIDVSSGETTIEVTNAGAVEHSFTLDEAIVGQDVEPGESATVTVNLTESIGFHCEFHPTQMTGTLQVS